LAKIEAEVSLGTHGRLQRIMQLRDCTMGEALDYAISMGWYMAERRDFERQDRDVERGKIR
jgi:hypothetical protein